MLIRLPPQSAFRMNIPEVLVVVAFFVLLMNPGIAAAQSCGSCSYSCTGSTSCMGEDGKSYSPTCDEANCDGDECCDGLGKCVAPICSANCIAGTPPTCYMSCGCEGDGDDSSTPSCLCDCSCNGLDRPAAPVIVGPTDGVHVPLSDQIALDWEDVNDWGEDQVSCTDGVVPCTCSQGQSYPDSNRRYELYLSTSSPTNLPSPTQPCVGSASMACSVTASSYTATSGGPFDTLQPGATYYWAVRSVNPGPGGSPGGNGRGDCVVRSDWALASFSVDSPPEVVNVEVLDNSSTTCRLSDGSMSRWTGDGPLSNNPIDIAVTVRDLDGWEEISAVYFQMSFPDPKYERPFNCYDELKDGVAITLWRHIFLSQGWRSAISMEVDESHCRPNCCYDTLSACEAQPGCSWSEEWNNFFEPSGCAGCRRDWNELPFSLSPSLLRYQFDRPCNWTGGGSTGCHGCYFQTDHVNYDIQGVTQTVHADSQTVTYVFTFEFDDSFEEGSYQMYAMARSSFVGGSLFSGGDQPGCSYATTAPCRTTEPSWTWNFDFSEPSVQVDSFHRPGESPETMRFEESVTDVRVTDSGIRQIFDRFYWIEREGIGRLPGAGAYYQIGSLVDLSGIPEWTGPQELKPSGSDPGFQGGDVVRSRISAMDVACNVAEGSDESADDTLVGQEWIQTIENDVYAGGSYFDPIPIAGEALGSYWLGGGHRNSCGLSNFESGVGSLSGWCLGSYADNNRYERHGEWYGELRRLAVNSTWTAENQGGRIVPISGADPAWWGNGNDGIFEYSEDQPLVVSGSCAGRKIVFSTADVVVDPDFVRSAPNSACLIVARSGTTITIRNGTSALSDVDTVQAAFVTDGVFEVIKDEVPPIYDRLLISGLVFSDVSSWLRDLIWEDNIRWPAERIEYDARYIDLLRDMLERRRFTDFECGIVQGSSSCLGWD